jgi:hypothetical protein
MFNFLATECIRVVSGAKKSEAKVFLILKIPIFKASMNAERLYAV